MLSKAQRVGLQRDIKALSIECEALNVVRFIDYVHQCIQIMIAFIIDNSIEHQTKSQVRIQERYAWSWQFKWPGIRVRTHHQSTNC